MVYPSIRTRVSNTRIAIIVPSTIKDKKIPKKVFLRRIKNTQRFLNRRFGGSTKIRASGSFILRNKRLVEENVAIVESFIPSKLTKKEISDVKNFVESKKDQWKQESLAFNYESAKRPATELHFVE